MTPCCPEGERLWAAEGIARRDHDVAFNALSVATDDATIEAYNAARDAWGLAGVALHAHVATHGGA